VLYYFVLAIIEPFNYMTFKLIRMVMLYPNISLVLIRKLIN